MMLKPGDFLYAIYDSGDEPKVEMARVLAVTAKRIKLAGASDRDTPGLAFGCRRSISHEEADEYGTTAHEAWVKYAARLSADVDRVEQDLTYYRNRLARVKARLQ